MRTMEPPRGPFPIAPAWSSGLVTAGLLLSSSGMAQAQLDERRWRGDVGVFVAYHFDTRSGRFSAGLDARVVNMRTDFQCGAGSELFGGAAARLALVGWDQVRLVIAPLAGRNNPWFAVSGEVGLGYRLGRDPGPLLQPGLEGSALSLLNARIGYAVARDFSVALGARTPHGSTGGCWVEGRPLRRDGGAAPLPPVLLDPSCAEPTREAAARVWASRAASEWASAPAFWELAQQLAVSGAPAPLLERARAAADDEIRHAVMAAARVAALTGRPVVLEPPARDHRAPAPGRTGLLRLAVESWTDGCLNEGAAAACAAAEAEAAAAPEVRHAQRTIARDESRHADLAWDILTWTLSAARTDVRRTLALGTPHVCPPSVVPEPSAMTPDLEAQGILPPRRRNQVGEASTARALARLGHLLV